MKHTGAVVCLVALLGSVGLVWSEESDVVEASTYIDETVPSERTVPVPDDAGEPIMVQDIAAGGTSKTAKTELALSNKSLEARVQALEHEQKVQWARIEKALMQLQEDQAALKRQLASQAAASAEKTVVAKETKSAMKTAPKLNPTSTHVMSEEDAYRSAFLLLTQKKYDDAIRGFDGVVKNYPKGDHTAPAYYWLGEIRLLKNDSEGAITSFKKVVNDFPKHGKSSEAALKLALIYQALQQPEVARRYFDWVIRVHPESSSAKRAKQRLSEMAH